MNDANPSRGISLGGEQEEKTLNNNSVEEAKIDCNDCKNESCNKCPNDMVHVANIVSHVRSGDDGYPFIVMDKDKPIGVLIPCDGADIDEAFSFMSTLEEELHSDHHDLIIKLKCERCEYNRKKYNKTS